MTTFPAVYHNDEVLVIFFSISYIQKKTIFRILSYSKEVSHPATRYRDDVVTTSLCTFQRRRRYVSNEAPNDVSMEHRQDVSVERPHDVLLERRGDVS